MIISVFDLVFGILAGWHLYRSHSLLVGSLASPCRHLKDLQIKTVVCLFSLVYVLRGGPQVAHW